MTEGMVVFLANCFVMVGFVIGVVKQLSRHAAKTNGDLQRQIDELKRELEEMKQKEIV